MVFYKSARSCILFSFSGHFFVSSKNNLACAADLRYAGNYKILSSGHPVLCGCCRRGGWSIRKVKGL